MQASHPRPRTDSSRSSAPSDPRIADLFAAFAAIWPRKWRVTEQSAQIWGFAVARIDEESIAAGIRHLIEVGEPWPPEPGAFAAICRDAQRQARRDIEASIRPAAPATPDPREAAWSAVAGTFALRMLGRSTRSTHDAGGFDVNAFVDAHQHTGLGPRTEIENHAVFRDLRRAFDAAWVRS